VSGQSGEFKSGKTMEVLDPMIGWNDYLRQLNSSEFCLGYHEKITIIHSSISKFPSNYRENHFARFIQGDDRLDLISLLKNILIVSPEWDEPSREESILFFFLPG
jgi:hypothetical protein